MSEPLHSIEVRALGDTAALVTIEGEIDLTNVGEIEGQVREQFRPPVGHVVIDLAGVTYLDSSAFAALERIRRSGALTLVVPKSALVHRAVMLSGLEHMIEIVGSLDDVLR